MTTAHTSPRWLPSSSPPSRRGLVLWLLAGALLVLGVPWFVPVRPAISESFYFGYSNRTALLLFVVWSLVFAVRYSSWVASGAACRSAREPDASVLETRGVLPAALVLVCLIQGTMWIYTQRFGAVHEARYMLDRLGHVAQGRQLFRQVEFVYGGGLLWFPLALSRTIRLSLTNAYFLSLVVEWLLGVLCCFYVVRTVLPAVHRDAVFLFLLISLHQSWLLCGAQYTPFRFWLTPAIAVGSFRLVIHRGRWMTGSLLLLTGIVAALLCSPEQAATLVAGLVLFTVLFVPWSRQGPVVIGVAVTALLTACSFLLLYRLGTLETALGMSSGGYNSPLVPSPILIPVLGLVVVGFCVLMEAVRRRAAPSAGLLLLCIGVFSLPAAFGRVDAVHLVANTYALAVPAWGVLALGERRWRWASRGYVWLLLVPLLLPSLLTALRLQQYASAVTRTRRSEAALSHPQQGPLLYSPLGPIETGPPGAEPPVDTGRFFGLENIVAEEQVQQKVAEIHRRRGETIVWMDRSCGMLPGRQFIVLQNLAPWLPKARHAGHMMDPICEELRRDFVVTGRGAGLPQGVYLAMPRENRPAKGAPGEAPPS